MCILDFFPAYIQSWQYQKADICPYLLSPNINRTYSKGKTTLLLYCFSRKLKILFLAIGCFEIL